MEEKTKEQVSIVCWGLILFFIGFVFGNVSKGVDIVSTKQIEPYKVVLTKVDGKVVKTFHYKQN